MPKKRLELVERREEPLGWSWADVLIEQRPDDHGEDWQEQQLNNGSSVL
jgi:hypothetical protein